MFFNEAQAIVDYGFVDTLVYVDGARDVLRNHLGGVKANLVTPKELASTVVPETSANEIAVYYAYGEIVDEKTSGLTGGGAEIVGGKIVDDLDKLMNDDKVMSVFITLFLLQKKETT